MTTTVLTAGSGATSKWVDGKRYLWLLSPFLPMLAFLVLAAAQLSQHYELTLLVPALLYVIIPLADWFIGTDTTNPPESAVRDLENDRYYRAIVYAYIPTQFATTVLATYMAVTGNPTWWQLIGLMMAAGVINGISINTAHELGHKKESFDRWMARLTLAPVAYGHFYVEHNKGHHKNVATPDDPASSKMGETFWGFLPRTVIGSLRSAWGIERERLARLGKSVWSLENENLQAWAMTVVFFGAITLWLGWTALVFLLVQAAFGAALLEVINYIEHYGLLRQKGADGRYERCQPHHSWNSNHIVTNLFLYQLQRHSDHHANPTRRFQALRHFDDSPQLPSGYASMLILAYFPTLWFRQMDPLVVRHFKGDLSRANIHAPKRAALLKRWTGKALDDGQPELFPGAAGSGTSSATPQAVAAAARYQCNNCSYVYDEAKGCPHEGFAPGTAWAAIPASWPCPDCAVREKPDFLPLD